LYNSTKQGVALTGRNHIGLPHSVSRPTAHAPGGRPARPSAALQTTTDDRRQRAKQYWPIRRASNTSIYKARREMACHVQSNQSNQLIVHWTRQRWNIAHTDTHTLLNVSCLLVMEETWYGHSFTRCRLKGVSSGHLDSRCHNERPTSRRS